MRKVIKFKLYSLATSKFISISTLILFLILNIQAVVNSGVLFSGGAEFNETLKYTLLLNNYTIVASFYGLLLSIIFGSSVIGPDVENGNIYILLSSYASRMKYYLGTYLAALLNMIVVQVFLLINIFVLFHIFDVNYLISDVAICFLEILINSLVVLSVTSLFSVFLKGYKSAFVGLIGYSFYNLYFFNEIPFINIDFIFNISQYKDILFSFFPIIYVLVPSYTEFDVIEKATIHPILFTPIIYQLLFSAVIILLGALCFKHKEL